MSFYNLLHGQNPNSKILLAVLGIDQPDGKWSSGRFRDIYLNADGSEITLFTRNGGGNREHWDDEKKEGEDCMCTGCIAQYHLPKHPNYIRDYDDDFDCTYASFVFSVPEEYRPLTKEMSDGKDPKPFSERFQESMKLMEGMSKEQFESDPRTSHIARAMKPLVEKLKSL